VDIQVVVMTEVLLPILLTNSHLPQMQMQQMLVIYRKEKDILQDKVQQRVDTLLAEMTSLEHQKITPSTNFRLQLMPTQLMLVIYQ
jgi:hypothetical protein